MKRSINFKTFKYRISGPFWAGSEHILLKNQEELNIPVFENKLQ